STAINSVDWLNADNHNRPRSRRGRKKPYRISVQKFPHRTTPHRKSMLSAWRLMTSNLQKYVSGDRGKEERHGSLLASSPNSPALLPTDSERSVTSSTCLRQCYSLRG